ncbi:MAG: OmpA family protein [Burkholderiales bacterium]|nr:OmpA family protein [Burkholderiales bacterium]
MNRTLTASALAAGALTSALLLGACASAPPTSPALQDARAALSRAEQDPAVLALAPLELKKATDTLNRANRLQAAGEPDSEVNTAAYIASQQVNTAVAIAQAKTADAAVAGSQAERERVRGEMQALDAQRARAQASTAQAQASTAQAQAGAARQQAAMSEQRASQAEQQTATAQASAADSQRQASQLQQRLDALQAQPTDRGLLVTLGDVLFETNRSEVKPAAMDSLRRLADFLQQYPARRILIEGHTDDVGAAATNERLSQRRADSVDNALKGMGIAAQRMATAGYGESYPVAANTTDTNRAMNRRVEIYITEGDQPVRLRR